MTTDKKSKTILVLDDDEVNLMILNKGVEDAGYDYRSFLSSKEAWDYLQKNAHEIDVALIDKMMPEIDGIEMLNRIKADDALKHIPVIIQTGDVGVEQMRQGLEAGAFYYLTKPYHPEILTAILNSAMNERNARNELQRHAKESKSASFLQVLQKAECVVRTLDEARMLASSLSEAAAYPEFAAVGLMELLTNAIEHGNLEVGYEQKRQWLLEGCWEEQVVQRLNDPKYADRIVKVEMQRTAGSFYVMIKDEGNGFEWQNYLYESEAQLRLNEPNGRGIAKAAIMLDDLRYVGSGNEVHCNIRLSLPSAGPNFSESLFRQKLAS